VSPSEVTERTFGGVAASELARAYGTPQLVIDTDVLDATLAELSALGAEFDIDVCYAGKALLFVALAQRIAQSSLGLDVCSLGELLTGERGGMPAERMVLHGCGKTADELRAAADGRVGRVVVDNAEELQALTAVARPERPVRVLLRVNTGIAARTHAYVRTGGEDSKFGFALPELDAAVAAVMAAQGLELVGFHSHLGSQIFEPSPYEASLPIVLDAFARAHAAGAEVREIVVGGGFGVDPHPGARGFELRGTLVALARELESGARERGIPRPKVGIEPGRAVIAAAGTSLYRVVSVKRQASRRFVIVDGGIADNPRPALYGAYHHPALANRISTAPADEFTICGRSCENDRLVVEALPGDIRTGDLLAMETTGAYTYSMASNYNRFGRPAVTFAGGGRHRLVVRREESADVLRNDVVEAMN
jgi:diaminopimelate decarboxylase